MRPGKNIRDDFMETKYGIISDIHRIDPRDVGFAMTALKTGGAQRLILNGDITGDQFEGLDEQNYLAHILEFAGKVGLETYAQPGSHEKVALFEPVVQAMIKRHGNLIYAVQNPKIELPDHHVVFLPGSDWMAGDASGKGYHFEKGGFKTGLYRTDAGHTMMVNTEDLRKHISDPGKTVIVCHVPRKFDNPEQAVDMAYFGEARRPFRTQNGIVEQGSVFPGPVGEYFIKLGAPVAMKRENRGNEDLKYLYEELGITKAVSGHFHESVHRANDRSGRHVQEGVFVDDLFWNASYMDGMRMGLLTVRDGRVAYENVNLNPR